MDRERRELSKSEISRLRQGDIFTVRTAGKHTHKHNAPGDIDSNSSVAKNPFNGPHWIEVRGAEMNTVYRVHVKNKNSSLVWADAIKEDKQRGTVIRWVRKNKGKEWEKSRSEPIEWDGTPQVRTDPGHNRIKNKGDVRGDKNDLLGGHL